MQMIKLSLSIKARDVSISLKHVVVEKISRHCALIVALLVIKIIFTSIISKVTNLQSVKILNVGIHIFLYSGLFYENTLAL